MTDRLRNALGCVHHVVSISGSWVTASRSTNKSVMVPGLFPLFCVQCKAELHCTESVTSGECELSFQEFAALEGLCVPRGCGREQDFSGEASDWDSLSSLCLPQFFYCSTLRQCWNSLQIIFSQRREVFVENPS